MNKTYVIAMILCVPLMLHGAAGDDAKRPFDPSEHIRVISEEKTMPHQLAFKWNDSYELIACLVADPQLIKYFPSDTAQQILDKNPIEFTLHSVVREFMQENLSVDALKVGITQNAITFLFSITASRVCSAFLRLADKKPKIEECGMMLLIGKNSKCGVRWRNEFYNQTNIATLIQRGERDAVQELKAAYLKINEHDIAIEIDSRTIRSKLAEIAPKRAEYRPRRRRGGLR